MLNKPFSWITILILTCVHPFVAASELPLIGYFDCDVKETSLMLVGEDGNINRYDKWESGIGKADKIRLTYIYNITDDHFRFEALDIFRDKELFQIVELYGAGKEKKGRVFHEKYFSINRDMLSSKFLFSDENIFFRGWESNMRLTQTTTFSWSGIITLYPPRNFGKKHTQVIGIKCNHNRDEREKIISHIVKVYQNNFGGTLLYN